MWEAASVQTDASHRPGTALLFALTLVECLLGKAKRDEVASPMVIADAL